MYLAVSLDVVSAVYRPRLHQHDSVLLHASPSLTSPVSHRLNGQPSLSLSGPPLVAAGQRARFCRWFWYCWTLKSLAAKKRTSSEVPLTDNQVKPSIRYGGTVSS